MRKHKHIQFEITTQYFKYGKQDTISAKCVDCGEDNPELLKILKDRENQHKQLTFEIYSPTYDYLYNYYKGRAS